MTRQDPQMKSIRHGSNHYLVLVGLFLGVILEASYEGFTRDGLGVGVGGDEEKRLGLEDLYDGLG